MIGGNKKKKKKGKKSVHDVVIVGGGAAGVGVAVALRDAGIKDFLLLERDVVGASFASWPSETRFITPSFPTNSIGMLDLNSIVIGTSPAYTLKAEHPSGKAYAAYLRAIVKHFKLPIREKVDVLGATKEDDEFHLETADGTIRARHVIWAAGEFQYPRLDGLDGAEHCRHTATIPTYDDLEGDDFVVIGGYESGIDAAYHLAYREKRVRLFDSGCPWKPKTSDPSIALSPYSLERMYEWPFAESVELHPNTSIASISREGDVHVVTTEEGSRFETSAPPLLAWGFKGGHELVANLFEQRDDGLPLLNEQDESTIAPGLFLCGPAVRHGGHVFCFIYKYRQRFAVVAKTIASSLGLRAKGLEQYREWGMFLDDLSLCGEECVC
ncbi:MAG: NAD(P)/FAD-dependent oxidoreductase [Acidobacteriota bacterium]